MVGSVREGAPPALARTAAAPLDTVPDDVAVFVTACARRDSCHALTSFLWVHHLTQIVRGGPALSTVRLIFIGSVVGFGSALTGTGGPVLLVPVLLTLGVTPLTAVAVSQAVQLPVVIAASATYLNAGLTDTGLGTVLGLAAATGTLIGAALAPRLHPDLLRRAVALACVTAGVLLLLRSV